MSSYCWLDWNLEWFVKYVSKVARIPRLGTILIFEIDETMHVEKETKQVIIEKELMRIFHLEI